MLDASRQRRRRQFKRPSDQEATVDCASITPHNAGSQLVKSTALQHSKSLGLALFICTLHGLARSGRA